MSVAHLKYIEYMHKNGHLNVAVMECGFFIHTEKSWPGASRDEVIEDPVSTVPTGLLEIKCPYSVRDKPAEEACQDRTFYCSFAEGSISLKNNHCYYHQIQL